MTVDIEKALGWMYSGLGTTFYSMDYRNGEVIDGLSGYDCSSSVTSALIYAGASNPGWLLNTEYMHDWLIQNGYVLISENQDWDAERGDVFIWGRRGQSAGAGGHTGLFIDPENIIHCNWARNGITIDNYNQTAAASGWMYCYVYRLENRPNIAAVKSVDELAQEVIAGLHGTGDDRKRALGAQYEAVQAKVNELLRQPQKAPEAPKMDTVRKEDGDLSFNGAVLKKSVLDLILKKCKEQDILPSYALTILHFEGLWGSSAVGKADNNWGGMTWTGQGNRPSGVTVTQGSARPASEGGHYMHYACVEDFLTDWFYLLRSGGSYNVSGAKTFSEAVKGMFKMGGAVYDYATSGFDNYIVGASSRLKAIEEENGSLAKYDVSTVDNVASADKIDIMIDGLAISINGVSYELTRKPV